MPYGITGQLVLSEGQRVNHFPNHIELTRKDLLAKNYRRAKKALEREGRHEELERFNFLPTTYTLPSENVMFLEEFKRGNHNHNSMWILKPVGKAQGRGIFLTSKLTHISEWIRDRGDKNDYVEPYVAQRYISNPYLVGGRKFDCRVYSLCLSFRPYLRCYLYREGFARFSTYRYTTHRDDIDNDFVHLTNVAIQKKGENYDSRTGMKWSLGEEEEEEEEEDGEKQKTQIERRLIDFSLLLFFRILKKAFHHYIWKRDCQQSLRTGERPDYQFFISRPTHYDIGQTL